LKYVGSKNKLSKELVPIIQSYVDNPLCQGYIEPFVGGANMIDKIKHKNKKGYDIHKYLIALLNQAKEDYTVFPKTISESLYSDVRENKDNYEDWFVGLVGFCATFGAKYFGGYARGFKEDKVTLRDIPSEGIRNLVKQAPNLKDTYFECKDFRHLSNIKGHVIYCDIPYKGTTDYKTGNFPYDEFYDWCREMSKCNVMLVSEYNMPNDFQCIWQKEQKVLIDSNKQSGDKGNIRIEKLFTYKV